MNIIEVISTQRKGRCLIEAQEKFQEAVKTATKLRKKAKFTLTIDIIPAETGVVVLDDDAVVKLPKPSKIGTSFYADEQGALHKEDPKQPELPEVVKVMDAAVNQ